jgi:two-component system cell cycle sensor histidine kinase/response regulator CckA
VVLVFRDQSEERRAQQALLESDARKGAILEAALDCIVSMDHTGAVTEFNPAAEKTFGYSRAAAMGKPLVDLIIPPSLRERHLAGLRRYLDTGVGPVLGKRIELQALRRDGSEIPVEFAVVRTRSEGAPTFTAYIRDLTERQRTAGALKTESAHRERAEQALSQTEEQLRQSQKMEAIGTLAGSIAHDFNNVLSVILGYGEMLVEGLETADPMREPLEEIGRAAERAKDLTHQLLAFSRQQVLEPKVVNLNDAIAGMTKMLRRIIGEDVELALLPASNLGTVFVDPGQVGQVLLNLVVNARDAMPRGGKLTIETADAELDSTYATDHPEVDAGRYVMLSVSDTGLGMDRATQARIFEPFYTTKERGKGTGLGLSTVFGIVKQSGGSIWVYSELGEGTTFKVYLPRSDAHVAAVEQKAPSLTTLRGSETILLVEDDEQVRNLAITILRHHGYDVLGAATGGDALLICEQHPGTIHALLTDVIMPRMSGRQLWERVAPLRPHMKVLFMSGYTDDAIVHHGVLSSEFAFVQKPLMPGTLLLKLRAVLDTPGKT